MSMDIDSESQCRISVIIAVYNGVRYLQEQMDALLAQRVDFAWEAIYVDNGSSDGSKELIAGRIARDKLTHVRLVDGSAQPGQVFARNFGSSLARAELLAYTDHDDLPAPDWLAQIVEALADADAVGGAIICTSRGYELAEDPHGPGSPHTTLPQWCGHDFAVGSNMGIHRLVFDRIGGWRDLEVHAGEDIDISIRLKQEGFHLAYAPKAEVTWRARVRIKDIWKQSITYGRSQVLLYIRFRDAGMSRRDLLSMLREVKQVVVALGGMFDCPRSYYGLFRMGLLCGRIVESIRSRVLFV